MSRIPYSITFSDQSAQIVWALNKDHAIRLIEGGIYGRTDWIEYEQLES